MNNKLVWAVPVVVVLGLVWWFAGGIGGRDVVKEMETNLRAISYPSYMTADFSEFEDTSCPLSNCSQDAIYTYPKNMGDSKAWADFSVLIKQSNFTTQGNGSPLQGTNQYLAHYQGTGEQCSTLWITQTLDENRFEIACR